MGFAKGKQGTGMGFTERKQGRGMGDGFRKGGKGDGFRSSLSVSRSLSVKGKQGRRERKWREKKGVSGKEGGREKIPGAERDADLQSTPMAD
ncbi:hypothetical protein SLA2020_437740 [Shorea laevis]